MGKKTTNAGGGVNSTPASIEEKAKEVWKNYPSAKEVYFSSDGFAFLQECDAKNHATSLKDQEVRIIKK